MIGKQIRELRIKKELTQAEVACSVGLTTSAFGMIETGVRQPSIEMLGKIADFFNVSVDVLLGRTEIHSGRESNGEKDDDRESNEGDYVASLFSKRLKSIREENELSQYKLAKDMNISRSAISSYEQGKREPDFEILQRIARYFNVTTDYLIGISAGRELNQKGGQSERTKIDMLDQKVETGGSIRLDNLPDILTVDELMKVMRIGRNKAYSLIREKGFPVMNIGGRRLIPKKALQEWIDGYNKQIRFSSNRQFQNERFKA